LRRPRLAADRLTVFVAVLLALAPLSGAARAQVAASVSGVVTDPNGAPLAGVAVTVRGPALQRESLAATTGADGAYRIAPLPPGTYSVSFVHEGFGTHTVDVLRAGVNEAVTLDVELPLETVEEEVHVVGVRPLVELDRSEAATRIEEAAIDTLPLKTRDPEDLVALVPGVTARPDAVRDQRFSIFGERPSATGYVYDGADNNDPLDGGSFQRYAQDAIQEFEVITTGYQAEFGRAQGGIVNVITRSGTNRGQGRAFYFHRDDSLDASNVPGQDAPELERDQWGLSAGGPIRRDRAFFFAAGEVVDEERGRNVDLSTVPDWVREGLATAEGAEDFSAGPTLEGATVLGKIDLLPTAAQHWTLYANYTDDDADGEIPTGIAGALVLPSAARLQEQDSLGGTLRQTTVLSAASVLESSARLLDGETGTNLDRTERAEAVLLLFASGFIQTGAQLPGGRADRELDRLALDQSWSRYQGDHALELGWEFLDTSLTGFEEVSNDVEYSAYFLAPDAIARNEDLFRRFGFEQAAARFFFLSASPDGSLDLDIDNEDLGLYAQDQWRLTGNVALDLGLRYDRASLFSDDDDNLAPRLGLTWDVSGRHRTVVKASAGLFYDQNALLAATGVPEKGGFFRQTGFDVALPRLGAVYTDSLIDLVITSGFPLGGGARSPAENPLYRAFAEDLRRDPLHLYRLFGIAVADPSSPPLVTADNILALSGLTPDAAVALLKSTYPGTDWIFFDVPGGSVVGDRVLSFLPRGPLSVTRTVQLYAEDRVPKTEAWTVGVEHQIAERYRLGVTLVKRDTSDVLTQRITNLFDVPPGHPDFGRTVDGGPLLSEVGYDGRIDYEGVTASVWRPFRDRWGFLASYTHSENDDNLLTGNVGSMFSNNNHPELDFGPSNLSVPNVLVASGTVELPLEVRLSGVASYRDGPAFSPRGIVDTDGDGLVDQRDLSQPRNRFRVDDVFTLDLRAEKLFPIGGAHRIAILVEAFNLTNEDNVASVNNVSGPAFGTPNGFLPGREIQLGVRYFFGGGAGNAE
jgi:outer membrane receptor protein involved in Fe transport